MSCNPYKLISEPCKPKLNVKFRRLSNPLGQLEFLEKAMIRYIDEYADFKEGKDWEGLAARRKLESFLENDKDFMTLREETMVKVWIQFDPINVYYESEPNISFGTDKAPDVINWKVTWSFMGETIDYIRQ